MTIQQALRSHADDGVNLDTIKAHLHEAAARIDYLERLEIELRDTREVCSLVRRLDYFNAPTPVLVEAQLVFERWRAAQDMIEFASAMQPDTNRPLNQWLTRVEEA